MNTEFESYCEYVNKNHSYIERLLKDIAVIPAPSGFEDKRAEFCLNFFKEIGCDNAYVDDAKNVVCVINGAENSDDLVCFMAHTDVVFPDTEPLPYEDDGENIYCPGIGDDTLPLVSLLMSVKYIKDNNIKLNQGIIFVANACEEGLGNLKGSKKIFADYGDRIKRMYTFDGQNDHVVTKSVGSHRYEVTVKTEGGHSYSKFGNRNAIAVLAEIISDIYRLKVPEKAGTKTTYNVGIVNGGTSVNTIAQEASMLCEYRSDDLECLNIMKDKFQNIFEAAKGKCLSLDIKLVGDRPCMKPVDKNIHTKMIETAKEIQGRFCGEVVRESSSSTDANIPLSLGIPALCIGTYSGGKAHTREEWIKKSSIDESVLIALELIMREGI